MLFARYDDEDGPEMEPEVCESCGKVFRTVKGIYCFTCSVSLGNVERCDVRSEVSA